MGEGDRGEKNVHIFLFMEWSRDMHVTLNRSHDIHMVLDRSHDIDVMPDRSHDIDVMPDRSHDMHVTLTCRRSTRKEVTSLRGERDSR